MIELNFPNEVSEEKDFYGRHREREQIERTLLSGTGRPVIILGERRIGKTSLQLVTAKALATKTGGRYVPLFLPPYRTMQSFEDYAKEILQTLCSCLLKSLHETGLIDSLGCFHFPSSYGEFADIVAQLTAEASDKTFVLCVDELDSIIRNCDLDAERVLGLTDHLISLGLAHRLPLLTYLTVSVLSPEIKDSYGSPSLSKSELVALTPWSCAEMEELLNGLLKEDVHVEDGGIEYLYDLSAGHPYFCKLLLDRLLARHWPSPPGVVTRQMIADIVPDAIRDRRAVSALQNIFRVHFNPEQKALVLLLADRKSKITSHELRTLGPRFLEAAKELDRRGYLTWSGREDYDFRLKLLGLWLRDWEEYEVQCDNHISGLREKLNTEIVIDEAQRDVRVRGESKRLGPQQFDALLCLARHPDEVVVRDELAEAVWGSIIASEENIDRVIYLLRQQLGDMAKPPRYVETVIGQGFKVRLAVLIPKA